jgi:hypothetical protein
MARTSLGSLYVDLLAKTGSFETDLGRAARVAEKRAKEINRAIGDAMDGAATRIAGFVAGLAVLDKALAFGGKMIATQRQFDILNAQLITATGSTQGASAAFENLQAFAAKTPFALEQSVEAFVKLTNLGLTPSERALTSYGNTAAAMGKDLMLLIEAVADATTGEFERLKEFGIKAKQEGDKVSLTFRGTTKTIQKSASEIESYLMALGENEFAGAMETRLDSLDGKLSGLADEFNKLILNVLSRGLGEDFKDSADAAAQALANINARIVAGEFDDLIKSVADATSGVASLATNVDLLVGTFEFLKDPVIAAGDVFRVFGTIITGLIITTDNFTSSLGNLLTLDMQGFIANIRGLQDGTTVLRNVLLYGQDVEGKSLIKLGNEEAKPKAAPKPGPDATEGALGVLDRLIASAAPAPKSTAEKPKRSGAAKKPEKSEAEKEAERLAKAYDDLLARQRESIALFGAEGEAAKLRYEIEFGGLKGLSEAKAAEVLANAERLDQMKAEAEVMAELDRIAEERQEAFERTLAEIGEETAALTMSNEQLEINNRLKQAGVDANTAYGEAIIKATEALQQQRDAAAAQAEVLDQVRSSGADALADIVSGAKSAKDAMIDFFDSIAQRLAQMIAERWMERAFGGMGTTGGGTAGGDIFGSVIGALFGGGRANGGPVSGGRVYGFMERGEPEVVTAGGKSWMFMPPGTNGMVTPAKAGGGAALTVNQMFNGRMTRQTEMQAAQQAGREAARAMRRNGG